MQVTADALMLLGCGLRPSKVEVPPKTMTRKTLLNKCHLCMNCKRLQEINLCGNGCQVVIYGSYLSGINAEFYIKREMRRLKMP